ncbi:MAG: Undecaprenyl phosphate N,N'-diacetylbacillosamine 1-phosphate transferase [Tenericutes bacterium ADurb.Bin239]|jgi:lipopolysaccharide/colanic/teichoic acid biosynthesis glycosyltransferase|nr:MAG: Undecaprenyl phosphate N,N'-diacetylbacillosamine 1-phosphate transferase [Tenericutes bacterium ADurb.Bin239]
MYRPIKRTMDFVLSLLAIIMLSPIFVVISILVRINLGAPVLFKQKRAGRYNKIFTLYKFRSMRTVYDENGELLPDEQRLTKLGLFLRKTSLDELPQLFNILFGHMTIIGPRPRVIFETMLMKDTKYVYRMAIKPGLSSWSVIHGRNNMRIDQALAYDFEHVVKFSFWLDLKIFFKTIGIVLKRTGINTDGYVTTKPISEFLIENNLKTPAEITEIKKESFDVEASNLKYIPMNISKEEFKAKRREIQKNRKSYTPSKIVTWD